MPVKIMTNEEKAALERDVRELWVQTDPIVSVAQMARRCGVGETTLHAWIKRWGMPSRPKHPCDATNKRDPSRPRRKSRARVRLPEGHPLYPLSFAAAQARMTGPAAAVEPVRAAVPAVAPAPVNVATANGFWRDVPAGRSDAEAAGGAEAEDITEPSQPHTETRADKRRRFAVGRKRAAPG